LQRKSGAATAALALKKERNGIDSSVAAELPAGACGGRVSTPDIKQEPKSSFGGVAIKLE
jgi:hypothetical protein